MPELQFAALPQFNVPAPLVQVCTSVTDQPKSFMIPQSILLGERLVTPADMDGLIKSLGNAD